MKTQNITIEKNMTAYNLIIGEYVDQHYGKEKFFFAWLKNGLTGEIVSWEKGADIRVISICYKIANINRADMTGILTGIKSRFPDAIGTVIVPDSYKSYQ